MSSFLEKAMGQQDGLLKTAPPRNTVDMESDIFLEDVV
jgi:hypothetical protein